MFTKNNQIKNLIKKFVSNKSGTFSKNNQIKYFIKTFVYKDLQRLQRTFKLKTL